MLYNSNI